MHTDSGLTYVVNFHAAFTRYPLYADYKRVTSQLIPFFPGTVRAAEVGGKKD